MNNLNELFEKYIGKHLHWESPRNWFTSAPEGSYNTIWSTADKKECFYFTLSVGALLLLLYTGAKAGSLPSVFGKISLVYFITLTLYSFVAVVSSFERFFGIPLPGEFMGLGDIIENPEKFEKTTILATALAFLYIVLNYIFKTTVAVFDVEFPYNFLLYVSLVVAIPYIEECFFSAAILATMAQRIGAIPSIVFTSILRVLYHIFIIGSKLASIPIFIWSVLISFVVLAYRTKYPAILSHAIINAVAYAYLLF